MNASGGQSLKQLILVPGVITLGVTLLRLIGELQNWSPVLFSRAPGGGAAIVGIAWLVFVFGAYFALELTKAGQAPRSAGRVIGFALLGFLVACLGFVGGALGLPFKAQLVLFAFASVAGIVVAFKGWPALARTLLAYGFVARIPVVIVMFFAIFGDWGTHYDKPAPQFPPSRPFVEWFMTGVLPQLTIWIYFTVVFGMIAGGIAVALTRKRVPAPA